MDIIFSIINTILICRYFNRLPNSVFPLIWLFVRLPAISVSIQIRKLTIIITYTISKHNLKFKLISYNICNG